MKTRIIQAYQISNTVVDLIYKASFSLPYAVEQRIGQMLKDEETDLARTTLRILQENNDIAGAEGLPLCQDCGVVIVFIEIGQAVLVEGSLAAAVTAALKRPTGNSACAGQLSRTLSSATIPGPTLPPSSMRILWRGTGFQLPCTSRAGDRKTCRR